MQFTKEMLIIFLVIVFLWWVLKPKSEMFGPNGRVFVPVGHDRYGLRGDLIRRVDFNDKVYIGQDRQNRLHHTGGLMYESDYSPEEEGLKGCNKTQCPCGPNDYTANDTCWQCDDGVPLPMKIPDVHPHVPN